MATERPARGDTQPESLLPFILELEKRKTAFRGEDVAIEMAGQCLRFAVYEEEKDRIELAARVPFGYFKDLGISLADESKAISAFLKWGCFSTRSRIAQLGIKLLDYRVPIEEIEASQDGRCWRFPVRVRNINPHRDITLPQGFFPLFRFFFLSPNSQLYGEDLQRRGLTLFSKKDAGKVWLTYEVLVLPIVRQAVFLRQPTGVNLEILANIKSTQRGRLDRVLGLSWKEDERQEIFGGDFLIGETLPVRMPPELVGLISEINPPREGDPLKHFWAHSDSRLIDPGFGGKRGRPIRLEQQVGGQTGVPHSEYPTYVRLALFVR